MWKGFRGEWGGGVGHGGVRREKSKREILVDITSNLWIEAN